MTTELTNEEVNLYLEHFPKTMSKELVDYTINTVFLKSRYIFTHREGKQQYGYCTHCKNEFKTQNLKHNKETVCPECHSTCIAKDSGRGRKYMVDDAYFVFYEKSEVDQDVIVARGIDAGRDYSGDYKETVTEYKVKTWYIFDTKNKKGIMFAEPSWWGRWMRDHINPQQYKSVGSYFHKYLSNKILYVGVSRDSIKEAVKGTPFSWSSWESIDHKDMTEFFDLYCKYPCVEYLNKLGFSNLVEGKLLGDKTYKTINWHGKNLLKVLKITKQELKIIKEKNIKVDYDFLALIQKSKTLNWNTSIEDIERLYDLFYYSDINELDKNFANIPMKKVISYVKNQFLKNKNQLHTQSSAFDTWKDYIKDCRSLEMDFSKENFLFPKNLYQAHQNTIKQVKYKEDQILNAAIERRFKELSKYNFSSRGLIIRPATSTKELIAEGKALSHCVGGYAERYAKGRTTILVIRKESELDKPYYTVEIDGNRVLQVRGKHNQAATEDVKAFMEEFEANRLITKKKNKKLEIVV